jgi:hypothetical protein
MKKAQGNTDYNVKSTIYKKFLSFLENSNDDKDNYRQCLWIISYAYYKDKNYSYAISHLEKLKTNLEEGEASLLGKNESLEQKIMNIQTSFQTKLSGNLKNNIAYFNEFGDYEFHQPPDVETLIKFRIFKQRVFYFIGLIKFLEFQKINDDLKNSGKSKTERQEAMKNEKHLLESAISYLKKAYEINNIMNCNQIKSIFIIILIAKCCCYCEENLEATTHLKDALLKFSDLNKNFFDKRLNEIIDPRVMFITNGMIIEQILFLLGRICHKSGKKQLAAWIYNKMIEITYFKSHNIYRKATQKLYNYLFENGNTNFPQKKDLLDRICRRIKKISPNKNLCLVMSENLLKNFGSSYELKEVLLKSLESYMNQNDLLSYFQFDDNINSSFSAETKTNILKKFSESQEFCNFAGNNDCEKPNFFKAMEHALSLLTDYDQYYQERNQETIDKYIFAFVYSKDLIFDSKDEVKKIVKEFRQHKISFYIFCFDENKDERRITKMKNSVLCHLLEGYLILVKNFKIIKQAFQNISNKGIEKNILKSNFESHKHIL